MTFEEDGEEDGEMTFETEGDEDVEMTFETAEKESDIEVKGDIVTSSQKSWEAGLLSAARFSLKHEYGSRTQSPKRVVSNRTSLRIEVSKLISDHYFFQLDALANTYWKNDHLAKANEKDHLTRTLTKEAYLQTSYGESSLKIGKQILIWGEADGMAITDVISPRDGSELYFISLEESRLGQSLIVWDQYTRSGGFSLFYNPSPRMDKTPEEGSEYELNVIDPTKVSIQSQKKKGGEVGIRWKKTVGKLDISLMAAHLMSNQYAYTADGTTGDGRVNLVEKPYFYPLFGATFVFAAGNMLWKGELARKANQAYNNASYEQIEKDVWDSYLGIEYASGSIYTVGLDLFNRHISSWNNEIEGTEQNEGSVGLNWHRSFLNEDLKVTLGAGYTYPYADLTFSTQVEYTWNDNLKFDFQLFTLESRNTNSPLHGVKDQDRVTGKIIYQF